jgi:sugar-specific transcriptional regulator TrmB
MILARLRLIREVRRQLDDEAEKRGISRLALRRKLRRAKIDDDQIAAKLKAEGAPSDVIRVRTGAIGDGKILDLLERALNWIKDNQETIRAVVLFFLGLLAL